VPEDDEPVALDILLLRVDDLVSLQIRAVNLRLDTENPNQGPALVSADPEQESLQVVRFPPQTIVEQAFLESGSGAMAQPVVNDPPPAVDPAAVEGFGGGAVDEGFGPARASPGVFISYAHDSNAHQEAVRNLWIPRRGCGIDAQLACRPSVARAGLGLSPTRSFAVGNACRDLFAVSRQGRREYIVETRVRRA
jgi:hypothetical protein